ncbi:DUF4184 family protein [Riemerella columbina]|uniref:DUF4184 family protein n=1 Tax=Riemerella columbina TaxID=103810 RepID=UPI0009FCC412|nr:DUF4184 family protein [Riemerella columbina]
MVRNSLLNHLPRVLQSRFTTFKALNWNSYFIRNWWVVLISIIIGSYSHLFWDAFTHTDGYFVKLIPELQNTISFLGIIHIPLFKILQHCSTLIGGMIILYYIYLLPKYDINTKPLQFKYWIIVAIITFFIVSFKLFLELNIKAYGNVIVTIIASTMLSLIITSLLMKSK